VTTHIERRDAIAGGSQGGDRAAVLGSKVAERRHADDPGTGRAVKLIGDAALGAAQELAGHRLSFSTNADNP
jgi:hypothetical protein